MGVQPPRLGATVAAVTLPHPERHQLRAELLDSDGWGVHRDFLPRNGLVASDKDPLLVNALYIGNITYLTPASAENVSTALLDGSHRLDGDFDSLSDLCPVVQPEAPAGSVLVFSE